MLQGDVIEHLHPIVVKCRRTFRYADEILDDKFRIVIWKSISEQAPRRKTDGSLPLDILNDSHLLTGSHVLEVSKLCTIVCHLDVPFTALPEHVNPGCVAYRILDIDILMSPRGSALDFSVRFHGMPLRTVSVPHASYAWS